MDDKSRILQLETEVAYLKKHSGEAFLDWLGFQNCCVELSGWEGGHPFRRTVTLTDALTDFRDFLRMKELQETKEIDKNLFKSIDSKKTTALEDSWKSIEAMPPPVMLEDLREPVRTTDPQASRDGARKSRHHRNALRLKVLQVFIMSGDNGATNEDIYKAYPDIKPDSLRPRVAELNRKGLIEECGRSLGSCGVSITRWHITDHAKAYLHRALKT